MVLSTRPQFHHEDFLVLLGDATEAKRGIDRTLELLGGKAVEFSPEEGPTIGPGGARGIIASIDALAASSPLQIEALRRHNEQIPLFVFPAHGESGFSPDATRVLRALGAPELAITDPGPIRTYAVSDSSLLWPFRGLRLTEEHYRVAAGVAPDSRGIDPLISSEAGCTFFRWQRGSQQVFASTTSPLEAVVAERLQDEFCPARFAALLPLMMFAKAALGDAGWRTPTPRATFMIDDPNLRFMRYGFLDYRTLVEAAKDRDLHFAIAMIPIDYKKTRQPVATFMYEHRKYMSLVLHGVEHLKLEFDREVDIDTAVATLRDGLRRMRIHHETTGVSFSPAMTFPYGECNSTWLEAMRRTGFQATFGTRTFSFNSETDMADSVETANDDFLYGMYPAEMTFQGFPIVDRFEAEEPKEDLLFHAWLGKPIVVCAHHDFFRHGMGPTLAVTDFLDRQVSPTWGNVESILNQNFQCKRSGQMREVRMFSNTITVATDGGLPISSVLKLGAGMQTQELARIDGAEVRVAHSDGLGLAVHELPGNREQLAISFEPRPSLEPIPPYRTPLKAGVRRFATEVRDRLSPLLSLGRRRGASSQRELVS
jgi:hypothetical protein